MHLIGLLHVTRQPRELHVLPLALPQRGEGRLIRTQPAGTRSVLFCAALGIDPLLILLGEDLRQLVGLELG